MTIYHAVLLLLFERFVKIWLARKTTETEQHTVMQTSYKECKGKQNKVMSTSRITEIQLMYNGEITTLLYMAIINISLK